MARVEIVKNGSLSSFYINGEGILVCDMITRNLQGRIRKVEVWEMVGMAKIFGRPEPVVKLQLKKTIE